MTRFIQPQMSSIVPASELEQLCDAYGIGAYNGLCQRLGGSYNVNLKIGTADGEFVIRLLNSAITEDRLRTTERLLELLKEADVPVIAPIASPAGVSWMSWEEKLLQVTPFVHAHSFRSRPAQVFASGQMLRRFHQALGEADPGPRPAYSFYPTDDYYAESIRRLKSVPNIAPGSIAKLEKLFEWTSLEWNHAGTLLPDAIIHGDWHFWNQGYSEDDTVRTVWDLDFMQSGKRLHDIAYGLWVVYVLLSRRSNELDKPFLEGYGRMTVQEQQLLPVATARVTLYFLCHAANAPNPAQKLKEKLAKQTPFLEWIATAGKKRIWNLTR